MLENNIISFKGKNEDDIGVSYIDTIEVGENQKSAIEEEIVLAVEFDNNSMKGNLIYNFAQSNGIIFIFFQKSLILTQENFL